MAKDRSVFHEAILLEHQLAGKHVGFCVKNGAVGRDRHARYGRMLRVLFRALAPLSADRP